MLLDQPGDAQNASAVALAAEHLQPVGPFRDLAKLDHRAHNGPVLTDKPHIVIARPPRRIRKASKPAKPVAMIVGRKVAPLQPDDQRDHAPAEAAERLWREMVRRVEEKRRL
jgi:hypothetical protein